MATKKKAASKSAKKPAAMKPVTQALSKSGLVSHISQHTGVDTKSTRAVLEALFGHQSEFTRTPKYGIERKTQSWKGARYLPMKSLLPLIELAFAGYFTYLLAHAFLEDQWLNVAFLAIFQIGFGYVALCSLAQWFPALRFPGRDTGEALPA